ncbi:L,D-transpeptidase [Mycolicibacterium phlei]|uniref:L,D-transpeptidase n=1 Tax=Mycolicibacterium phlei TaxID=1771 RepID=UPI00178C29F4|nr:L,D-transpeptidase [Mycolicibacterium phlei]
MRQPMRRRLLSATAAGLVGVLVLTTPVAMAQPVDPPPPPGPVDPAAAAPPAPVPIGPPAPGQPSAGPETPPPALAAEPGAQPEQPAPFNLPQLSGNQQPLPIPEGTPEGQNPLPYTGEPVFLPPSFNPVNGALVGVAKPIIIKFQRPIANKALAESAVHISSDPPVPGRFYWISDTELRWRPQDFWPADTVVNIDAGGTRSSFRVGESLVATVDDKTKRMEIHRNGELEKTFKVSMGKKGYETRNGTYYVLEKFEEIVMDSSTYGVPVDDPEGYKIKVKHAVRIDNSGIFVHGAPWSVGAQGSSNVSHGCINLAPKDAEWFYQNFGSGDPVVVKNTSGPLYTQQDGAHDWQLF